MAMTGHLIASRVSVRHRYVRSVNLMRDVDDPDALDGYVMTPSVRDAVIRILAGLSPESSQRAFRIVGPYGTGKSAFGVFLAQLLREHGEGPATMLLSEATDGPIDIAPWRPTIISGRRVGFARELLRVVVDSRNECGIAYGALKARAKSMLAHDGALDTHAVVALIVEMAAELRRETGEGLLFLVDEMGRFLEYAATRIDTEDPSIFQTLAEHSGGRSGSDLAVVGFLHHRFADYVAGMGRWIEAEWVRSAERYEELSFGESTEQSLFMLARALAPVRRHTAAVRKRSEEVYGEAVDRSLFAVTREEVVALAPNLYPLHPAAVAVLASAIRRFGQNERSLFGFLQSFEPDGLMRFAHTARYGHRHWYLAPRAFDHLAVTISEAPGGDRARRWSLAFDALANAADLSQNHRNVLKTVALVAVLEPIPGLVATADTISWCLEINVAEAQGILDELAKRNLIYRRSHRSDYGLWSSSSVDLSRWLDEARTKIRTPERLEEVGSFLMSSRPVIAHRHYHATGNLRTFEVRLWTGESITARQTDGLILIVPIHPDGNRETVLRNAMKAVEDDPLALVCARTVASEDLKWAHELSIWSWIRGNCEELKVDELARGEVDERISDANRAITHATALLSSMSSVREEEWWYTGKSVAMPEGLSAFLSDICDKAYNHAPILRNELINRVKLSPAITSARTRLLDRMLTCADKAHLGIDGAPPERTIYLSLFQASGIHTKNELGRFVFRPPSSEDPCRWGHIWRYIEKRLDNDESISFATLMEELARPPYGLCAGPALLVITAFILASRDSIAIMERNSFQPDLTVAHFMRLAKSPGNFAIRSLHETPVRKSIIQTLATRLNVVSPCSPTITGVSENLFAWYNSLPSYALKTASLSSMAIAVRTALHKASEPGRLFFHNLPAACNVMAKNGEINVEHFAESLNEILLEIDEVTQKLRSQAAAAALSAFSARNMATLRSQIRDDYEPHRLELADYHLRAFVERAMNTKVSDDRWLDGVAGQITGRRPDNWEDDTLDRFDFEIRVIAGNLAKWLALARTRCARSIDLKSVHVVGIDGQERVIFVRRDRPNPALEWQLNTIRKVLENNPHAMEVLGQLLAEYADTQVRRREKKWTNSI